MGILNRIRQRLPGGKSTTKQITLDVPPLNWFQTGYSPPGLTGTGLVLEACVSATAQTVARMPLHHVRTLSDGSTERLTGTRVAELLRVPNHYQTRSDFILNLIRGLLVQGNGYMLGIHDGPRTFSALHLLDPRSTRPHVAGQEHAIFHSTGGSEMDLIEMDPASIIPTRYIGHVRLFTPRDPLIGVSPIEAASGALATHNAISASQTAFFNNMSRPSGVLKTEKDLNGEQLNLLRDTWEPQAKGLNRGQVPILTSGLGWELLSITSLDSQLADVWRMNMQDIARAFRIPPALIGDLEHSSFANVSEMMSFWLARGLGFITDAIESKLAVLFSLPPDQPIEFDTSVLLQMDMKQDRCARCRRSQRHLLTQ